ncbi:MAG: sulfatase [Pirellulales bacterium]
MLEWIVNIKNLRCLQNHYHGCRLALLWVWLIAMPMRDAYAADPSLPNIVVILADDLGIRDLECYGSDLHETPNIDRLASSGMRFLNAYAPAPVCSPTRASILTGKSPARLQITIWSEGSLVSPKNRKLQQGFSRHDLPLEEVTIAEHLQQKNYITASVGKWHLGDASHFPETQGFDIGIGGNHWGAPATYFFPYRGGNRFGAEFRYVPHLGFGKSGEYLTDRLTEESLRVIEYAHAEKRPFLLYLAHHAPHTPIEAKPDDIEYFDRKLKQLKQPTLHKNAPYAAMLKSLDESVGKVYATLERLGMLENTWVVFTSDNGGYIGTDKAQTIPVTTNAPWRSGKGSLYEGGIRVPLIVAGLTVKPNQTTDCPVVLTDLFPTMAAWGRSAVDPTSLEGVDLNPLLNQDAKQLPPRDFFFHYPHYYHAPATTPCSAIRSGDWKLIENFETQDYELYNLSIDPSESQNLAPQNPSQVQALLSKLHSWHHSTHASLPNH